MRDTHGSRYTRAAFPHNAAAYTYSRHRFHTICSVLGCNEQPYVAEHRSTTEALVRCVTDKLHKTCRSGSNQLRLSSGGRRCLKACGGKGQQVGTKGHAYRVKHVCLQLAVSVHVLGSELVAVLRLVSPHSPPKRDGLEVEGALSTLRGGRKRRRGTYRYKHGAESYNGGIKR